MAPVITTMVTDNPSVVIPRNLFLARELSEAEAYQYLKSRGARDPRKGNTLIENAYRSTNLRCSAQWPRAHASDFGD